MIYIYLNPATDFAIENNQNYIFFSSNTKKYIVLKKNRHLDFILNIFATGDYYHNYRRYIEDKNKEHKYYDKIINLLICKDILHYDIIENDIIPKNIYVPDLFYDNRYGYQNKYLRDRFFTNYKFFNPTTEIIRKKNITIVGLGAVGSFIAVMCASIGIGNITLIDGDYVEESNLTRQIFFKEKDVGKVYKVDSLKEYISTLNKNVKINAINKYITGNFNFSKV
ncbi:HesA/MoeB/ThiF family protein [Ignavigranum ruoffiae]|uniref:HesA/MoeB/ThiF family protein n=1 Tax=Ignavigranum ruoffiae TaxID=89093 RepID=UPI0024AD95F9|nr:ThiF family adenylyltransferase [Ignavigranum ruoffiae]